VEETRGGSKYEIDAEEEKYFLVSESALTKPLSVCHAPLDHALGKSGLEGSYVRGVEDGNVLL
jgi:hypothetical protein